MRTNYESNVSIDFRVVSKARGSHENATLFIKYSRLKSFCANREKLE